MSNPQLQPPNDMNPVEQFLLHYGIDIGFLVSGFFGALLLVSRNSAQKLSTTIASILAGTACANYLTPVVMSILPDKVQINGKYAVAFIMGFLGLKGLELTLNKLFKMKAVVEIPEKPKKIKNTNNKKKNPRKR